MILFGHENQLNDVSNSSFWCGSPCSINRKKNPVNLATLGKIIIHTRMHSSRMRTAHSLTVSLYLIVSHACPPPCMRATTHAPQSNHACPPEATMYAPQQPHMSPGATTHATIHPQRATTHAPPQSNHAHPPEQPCMPPREQPCMPPKATMHSPPRATMHVQQPCTHPPPSNHTRLPLWTE